MRFSAALAAAVLAPILSAHAADIPVAVGADQGVRSSPVLTTSPLIHVTIDSSHSTLPM
jgi:hypothetical protein